MAKRKYQHHGQGVWEQIKQIDWTINPDTAREVAAVILLIVGILALLGFFNAAGIFGKFFSNSSIYIFGFVGFIVPAIFIFYAVSLFLPEKIKIKPASVIGAVLTLIFLPGLLNELGGHLGNGVNNLFVKFFGVYASLIILFALTVISLLVTFNTSLKTLWDKLAEQRLGDNSEPKASVFTTLRQPSPASAAHITAVTARLSADKNWNFPPINLLEVASGKATSGNIPKNVEIIQKSLKDFNIDVSMGDVNVGPTVTQYTLKPTEGVKLNQITARANDLSLALAMHPIRIEAPIPGKAAVGIEVPNKISALVTLREILESEEFKAAKSNLTLALGRDVAGTAYATDLKKMPHLLIAGATGSGKSVCVNSIIISLLYQNSPSDLRLILVDPKRVEFTHYNDIPHLLSPVVFEVDKTVSTLKWTVAEMDRRFRLLQETGNRNIEAYNTNPVQGRMPYIVLIIDELADLMAQAGNEVEGAIVRLAQMARAVGIHMILATQRPSVDVITGLIKANITNRVAFAVASQIDSRTILDTSGAEKLLGNGDMLHLGNELGKPKRIQGVLVTDKEISKVTDFLKEQSTPQYDDSIAHYRAGGDKSISGDSAGSDELYEEAKEIVVMAGKASASLLQRRLRVGYARAARLLDILEENGAIGPAEGAKPRDVLIDPVELDHERAQARVPLNNPPANASFGRNYQNFNPGFNPGSEDNQSSEDKNF